MAGFQVAALPSPPWFGAVSLEVSCKPIVLQKLVPLPGAWPPSFGAAVRVAVIAWAAACTGAAM